MVHRALLAKLVAKRNREIALQAAIELALGVVFSIVVFGAVFWIAYIAGFFCLSIWKPLNLALGVTGVFATVSTVSAWRQVDPFAGVSPLTDAQELREDLAQALGYAAGVPVVTRHSIAGAGSVLIGGPANIFESISTYRDRLPSGSGILSRAAELLESAQSGILLEDVPDPRAALLLHRLALVKLDLVSQGAARLVLTQKGMELRSAGR